MLKRYLMVLTLVLALPAFANAWILNAKTSTTGQGTISPAGNKTYAAGVDSDPYTVTPETALGYKLARVTLDGVTLAPNADGKYVAPYSATKSYRYLVAYFTKNTVNVQVSAGAGGAVREDNFESLTKIPVGSARTFLVIPNPGYAINSVTAAGATITDDAVTGYKKVSFSNLQANQSVSASFSLVPVLAAYAGSDVSINGNGAAYTSTLQGRATSNVSGAVCNWSGAGLTFGTPTAPAAGKPVNAGDPSEGSCSTTVYANAAGTYTATLTVTAGSLTRTDTVLVKVADTLAYETANCTSCHSTQLVHGTVDLRCARCHNMHQGQTAEAPAAMPYHATPDAAAPTCNTCHIATAANFATSLHGVRPGKETFYTDGMGETNPAPLQQGFGNFVNVPYSDLPCAGCHDTNATVVDGVDTWAGAACTNCHNQSAPATPVAVNTCYGCHSRQAYEMNAAAGFGLTDVHITAGMTCANCHSYTDMHGDGTPDKSMLDPGAITANCGNCHGEGKSRGPISQIAEHRIHMNDIDCSTCHAQSMVACYNCHFDNEGLHEGVTHQKFASAKFGGQGAKSWRFLVNRVMPDGSTKVFPGSMQSLMADVTAIDGTDVEDQVIGDGQGKTFVAIASYYSHSITKVDALRCFDCHGTAKVTALASGQPVDVVKWLGAEGEVVPFGAPMMAKWQGPQGVIPVPENVSLLKFDFVDLTEPAAAWNPTAGNVVSPRVLFKRGADVIHMPDSYVKPLTAEQMQKLADPQLDHASETVTGATPSTGYTANTCQGCHESVNATYATSQHFTKTGKATWFNDHLGNTEPTLELQTGFGNYVSVGYNELPCQNCHNGNDNGPWDTDPTAGVNVQAWPGANCTECHTNRTTYGVQTTSFDAPVTKATCYGCHSRQKKEAAAVASGGAGLVDVHTNGIDDDGDGQVEDLTCMGCHSLTDMHGNGTQSATQLQWGTISANCANCHGEGKQQGPVTAVSRLSVAIPEHDALHLAKLDCSTCHVESVVTCNNCHFDNEMGGEGIRKLKFASGFFGGLYNADPALNKSWRYLLNRVMPDGSTKVYPGSMQSLYTDVYAKNAPGSGAVAGQGDDQGWSHAGIAPYYSHSITRVNALKCDQCHGVQNAIDLNNGQPIRVVTWTGTDTETVAPASLGTKLKGPKGIVPVPENPRGKLLMDFVDLVDPNAALNATSDNVTSARKLAKRDGPDSIHIPEAYARPLTAAQINALATPQARP